MHKNKMLVISLTAILIMAFSTSFFAQEKKNEPFKVSGFIDFVSVVRTSSEAKTDLGKSQMNLYLLGLNLDGSMGMYGFHATVQVTGTGANAGSSTKNFPDYASPIFLEEGYVYVTLPFADSKLKVGSIYTPFGLQGDNSWYYSYHYYAGLSVDADYGVVYDGTFKASKMIDINLALGYFLVDDRQNGTRNGGLGVGVENDTNAEERDTFVGRLAATFNFSEKTSLAVGGSLMMGRIENNAGDTAEDSKQFVVEGDIDYNVSFGKSGFRVFGEYVSAQRNKDNVTFGSGNDNKNYNLWLAGATFSHEIGSSYLKAIDIHGNYSQVKLHGTVGTTSDLLIIGTALTLNDALTMTIEYVKGKNDTSLGISNNRFDDALIIDLFYEF